METALIQYFVIFGLAFMGGVLGATVAVFACVRFTRMLGYRVSDIEDRLATLGGKKAAQARWDKDDKWMETAMSTKAKPVRYDNDPPELEK